jgi:hypothetical protein
MNQAQNQTFAQVFGSRSESASETRYSWKPGDFAVVLKWDKKVDLDLELWSENFDYIGSSSMLGGTHDIYDGNMGEEWIVFDKNMRENRYIVSTLYYLGETEHVDVNLFIYFPDGNIENMECTLFNVPPYSQWFSIMVDISTQEYKIMDFFYDAELIAILEWDSEIDLDLIIYDHYYENFFSSVDCLGRDSVNGREACEIFRFCRESYESYDFSSGRMDIYVRTNDIDIPKTNATLKIIHIDGNYSLFKHTLTPEKHKYFWHVVRNLDVQTLDFEEPQTERIYLD